MNAPAIRPTGILLSRIRVVLSVFIVGLVLSGLTAFPLLHEVEWLSSVLGVSESAPADLGGGFGFWIATVRNGLRDMHRRYPWIGYGTDWLAFAHLVIAVFFIGPLIDPVRNVWVLRAGVIACIGVIPLALICGPIRQIPMGWRLIDCSFGVLGMIPLLYCLQMTKKLQRPPDSRWLKE